MGQSSVITSTFQCFMIHLKPAIMRPPQSLLRANSAVPSFSPSWFHLNISDTYSTPVSSPSPNPTIPRKPSPDVSFSMKSFYSRKHFSSSLCAPSILDISFLCPPHAAVVLVLSLDSDREGRDNIFPPQNGRCSFLVYHYSGPHHYTELFHHQALKLRSSHSDHKPALLHTKFLLCLFDKLLKISGNFPCPLSAFNFFHVQLSKPSLLGLLGKIKCPIKQANHSHHSLSNISRSLGFRYHLSGVTPTQQNHTLG